MSDLSIKAEGISKEYIIGGAETHYDSFREMFTNAIKNPWQKYKKLQGESESLKRFWALNDINFEIQKGEVVGIIGHNGAGKSTLLKILSRITTPTSGQIELHGRVASLLEVGTGFHPELTGRENIYLNGSILGMKRSEIHQSFDEIVDFSGIEKFLDTPVKRYSSGMYVRLAFSVAAFLSSDVLLVDEVLAVGDQDFQTRCLGKLSDVSSKGRTVIFVSHNLSAVSSLCDRGLLLGRGKVLFDGSVTETLNAYNSEAQVVKRDVTLSDENPVFIKSVIFTNERSQDETVLEPGGSCQVLINLESYRDLSNLFINIGIYDQNDQRLALLSNDSGVLNNHVLKSGVNELICNIHSLPLVYGRYYIKVAVLRDKEVLDAVQHACGFSINNSENILTESNGYGPVALNYDWHLK